MSRALDDHRRRNNAAIAARRSLPGRPIRSSLFRRRQSKKNTDSGIVSRIDRYRVRGRTCASCPEKDRACRCFKRDRFAVENQCFGVQACARLRRSRSAAVGQFVSGSGEHAHVVAGLVNLHARPVQLPFDRCRSGCGRGRRLMSSAGCASIGRERLKQLDRNCLQTVAAPCVSAAPRRRRYRRRPSPRGELLPQEGSRRSPPLRSSNPRARLAAARRSAVVAETTAPARSPPQTVPSANVCARPTEPRPVLRAIWPSVWSTARSSSRALHAAAVLAFRSASSRCRLFLALFHQQDRRHLRRSRRAAIVRNRPAISAIFDRRLDVAPTRSEVSTRSRNNVMQTHSCCWPLDDVDAAAFIADQTWCLQGSGQRNKPGAKRMCGRRCLVGQSHASAGGAASFTPGTAV